MNYTQLNEKLQGRNKESRKEANNTYLKRRGNNIALLYHETDVAVFTPDGDIILHNGGWVTSTTKNRLNMALAGTSLRIWQEKGVWYLWNWHEHTKVCRYQDGVTIKADGSIVGGLTETPNRTKMDRIIKKRVKDYAQKCADAVPLDKPSGGDCWDCSMVTEDGTPMGDLSHSNHLDQHMKENYIVPSLVYNALKAHYNAPMAFWDAFKDTGVPDDSDRHFGRQAVKKAVYHYILRRKGYNV